MEFAPFGSKENRNSGKTDENVPRPSAKSVYRLADKVRPSSITQDTLVTLQLRAQYDTPTLKDLALRHIHSELKNSDIIEETFCSFTSR